MPYTQQQIQANWARLHQLIEESHINVHTAGASDRNNQITQLQRVLRNFFVEVISKQHGNVVEVGDEVFADGRHAELMNFDRGATFNGRYYPTKQAFLAAQAKPGDWAEDAFLSAGFAALGIQPIYHYAGMVEVPFAIQEAVTVANLQNHGNMHWTLRGRQNAGGGDCGLYSAAQAVAGVWTSIQNWFNNGVSPFKSTAGALQNIKTRARKDAEERQAYLSIVAQLRDRPFVELLQLYVNLVAAAEDDGLRDAILIERAPNRGGMPADIQEDLRALVVPLWADNRGEVNLPADLSAQRQTELRPYLVNILAHYLKRDPATTALILKDPSVPPSSSKTLTYKAPVVFPPAKPDAAQARFLEAEKILKKSQFELAPLQMMYQEASRLFNFTYDPANNTEEKIIKALANACKNDPAFSDRLNFFLTPVKMKAAL